ncbi:hypothetical protein A9Q77_07815 [Marinomonas sp. 42_23_T18]|nr:hypothetical protein A9Q77_07815 [Marinomonas sp. 42_23_T18]
MSFSYKKHKLIFIISSLLAASFLFAIAHFFASQALMLKLHQQGQNQLLTYVADLRRELNEYRHMPYSVTDNPAIRTFMSNPQPTPYLQRYLKDIAKVSGANDWFILNQDGAILLSTNDQAKSVLAPFFSRKTLAKQLIKQQGEAGLLTGYNKEYTQSAQLLTAPIYGSGKLLGAIAIQIQLSNLIESWTVSGEIIAITDKENNLFLANDDLNWSRDKKSLQLGLRYPLIDGTNTFQITIENKDYMLHSVILDDLEWQLHYLSPMKSSKQTANYISFVSLMIGSLLIVFALYRNERALKIASKIENEHLLEQNEQRQKALIEKTHVGLIQLDNLGNILFINPTGQAYFRHQPQLIGQHLSQLLAPEFTYPNFHQQPNLSLNDFFNSITIKEHEAWLKREKQDVFPALISISPINWAHSTGFLVTLIDISKRKQAEQALIAVNNSLESRVENRSNELKAAQKELLRTEKLAAIGQMSTAIAHELNQPLTGLRTLVYSAELLLSRNQIKETQNTLSQVEAMISRMHKLTSELKVIAYQRPEKLGLTRLEDCIDKALISLGSKVDDLDIQVHLNEYYVNAEPTRLERIFANLFSNTLDACYEHKISAKIFFTSELIDNKVQIRIDDNGPGVDESTLSHLFEPFYTSKSIGKGLGLGLAISANLAKDMQGTLTVKQGTYSGLTFILTLEQTAP